MISGKHISSFQEHTLSIVIPSVKRFSTAADLFDKPISLTSKNLSSDFRKTHFVEKPPFLRSSFVRRPSFVRRRANKQWPYRRATDPHPYPSLPLIKFLKLLLVVLAKLVTEGLYQIGQMDLDTACFTVEDGHLAPKFYLMRSRC